MSDRTEDLWGEGGVFDQLSDALNLVPQATFDRYAEAARINAALWTATYEGRRTEVIDRTLSDVDVLEHASERVEAHIDWLDEPVRVPRPCCGQGCVHCEGTQPEGD